jgi:hypothetical protein
MHPTQGASRRAGGGVRSSKQCSQIAKFIARSLIFMTEERPALLNADCVRTKGREGMSRPREAGIRIHLYRVHGYRAQMTFDEEERKNSWPTEEE